MHADISTLRYPAADLQPSQHSHSSHQALSHLGVLCASDVLLPLLATMVSSDDDYVEDITDNDVEAHQIRGATGTSKATGTGIRGGGGWEVTRTWENVVEGADGTINSTVEGLLEAGKRKR